MGKLIIAFLLIANGVFGQINLPIMDDFAQRKGYRDGELSDVFWQDNYVKVDYTIYNEDQPASVGAAIFDGRNENGQIYENADIYGYKADDMTSKPINMSGKSNVHLTFRYQSGGISDPLPHGESDKLLLQFKSPTEGWETIWEVYADKNGTFHEYNYLTNTGNTFGYNTNYNDVDIEISQSRFLADGFQFRFRNKVSVPFLNRIPSLGGFQDQWLLDWVYLDEGRSANDFTQNDIGFIRHDTPDYEDLRLLENYHSIPWEHWPDAKNYEMQSDLGITYRNFSDNSYNFSRRFEIIDVWGSEPVYSFSGGTSDGIPAHTSEGYPTTISYTFPENTMDSALYIVKAYLITDTDMTGVRPYYRQNDTIFDYHYFKDYYALDDGSPEYGYFIKMEEDNINSVRQEFNNYHTDYITGVAMYFMQGQENADENNFDIEVIDAYGNQQINERFSKPLKSGWHKFNFSTPWEIPGRISSQPYPFKIEIETQNDEPIVIGWDANTDNKNKIEYNIGNGWQYTEKTGTLMIRPVFN